MCLSARKKQDEKKHLEGALFHWSLISFLHKILYCLCCDLFAHCLKFVCQHYILQDTAEWKSFWLVYSKHIEVFVIMEEQEQGQCCP